MVKPPQGTEKGTEYGEHERKLRMKWDPDEGFKLYCYELHPGGQPWTTTDVAKAMNKPVTTVDNYATKHKWKFNREQILVKKGRPGFGDGKGEIIEAEFVEVGESETVPEVDETQLVDYWDKKFVERVKTVDSMVADELLKLQKILVDRNSLSERDAAAKILNTLVKTLEGLQKLQRTAENKKMPGSGVSITNQTLVVPGALPPSQIQSEEAQRVLDAIQMIQGGQTKALPAPYLEDGVIDGQGQSDA